MAREEALTHTRFTLLERELERRGRASELEAIQETFRYEAYLEQLEKLEGEIARALRSLTYYGDRTELAPAAADVAATMRSDARELFGVNATRKSDFFRDIASASFMAAAERVAAAGKKVSFERLSSLFDRAILDVETRLEKRDVTALMRRAAAHHNLEDAALAANEPIDEVSFVGTGYGRQTLPFPKQAVRSEILCHGRGAHRIFPGTRTVLDIGGQDTKAIQVDGHGVVTTLPDERPLRCGLRAVPRVHR